MKEDTLFIFIDESGNFDFSPTGTKNFILTAVSTIYPLRGRDSLSRYRYALLGSGVDEEYFHATEDTQEIRNSVYDLISSYDDLHIDSVIAQKNKANSSLYTEYHERDGKVVTTTTGVEFYRIICQSLLQYILRRHRFSDIDNIVVVLDALFTYSKKQTVLKSLKTYLKQHFDKPCYIFFHQSKSDVNCQIADYCGWAIYVKNERQEIRPFEKIHQKIKSEFLIFAKGKTEYYQYKS